MLSDLRVAVRRLMEARGFTVMALATLALGIGANTAIFGVVHSVVLRPLPYAAPDRLVAVELRVEREAVETVFPWPTPRFEALRDRARSFEGVAGFAARDVNLTGHGEAERLRHETVSASYFEVLGESAQAGRTFADAEDDAAAPAAVAVISDGLWRRRFGGSREAMGATIRLNGLPFTVVGVMPASFRGMASGTDVWTPMAMSPAVYDIPERLTRANAGWHQALARLAPGATLESAAAELERLRPELESLHPSPARTPLRPVVRSLLEAKIDPALRDAVRVLFAAVTLVLLIACANLANLLLARSVSRRKELAVRRAVGASPGALARLTLLEALLLGTAGGALGLLVALWGTELLTSMRPESVSGVWAAYARTVDAESLRVGGAVLAFNVVVSLSTAALFGVLPAVRSARVEVGDALRPASRAYAGAGRDVRGLGVRSALVVSQMALAVVLVAAAGLVVKSFVRLLATEVGARSESIATFRIDLPRAEYGVERTRVFFAELRRRLDSLPGVTSTGIANSLPASGQTEMTVAAETPAEPMIPVGVHMVSPGYFETFAIAVLEGRIPSEAEHAAAAPVAVINEAAARALLPSGEALGRSLSIAIDGLQPRVIGVVADVRYDGVEAPVGPDLYISDALYGTESRYVALRTEPGRPAPLDAVRRELQVMDPDLPMYDVRPMDDRIGAAVSRTRFAAVMLAAFAGIALVLALVGVYGVAAGAAAARTREIGIRMALGARAGRVVRDLVRDVAVLAAVALLIGVPAALAAARVLRSLLYEVGPNDPITFVAVGAIVAATALLASWAPARRAARTDPMIVLRHE